MELSRLRRELHDTRADLERTRIQVERLEGRVTLLTAGQRDDAPPSPESRPSDEPSVAAAPSALAKKEAAPRRNVPALPVVRLKPPAKDEDGAQDDGGPPILIKVGPDAAEKLSVDKEVLKRPDPVLGEIPPAKPAKKKLTKADLAAAKLEYDQALSMLREQNKPDRARSLFQSFQGRYPESELIPNAAYWLAECSFAEGNHAQAAGEFLKVASAYPASVKVPDALLRAGESYLKLKNFQKASDLLKRVKDSYPGSDVASEADKALRELADGTKR
jgi:tol-pal system protein YbgF